MTPADTIAAIDAWQDAARAAVAGETMGLWEAAGHRYAELVAALHSSGPVTHDGGRWAVAFQGQFRGWQVTCRPLYPVPATKEIDLSRLGA